MDLLFHNCGTVVLLSAESDAGRAWIDENIADGSLCMGGDVAIEHRFAQDILDGANADGLATEIVQ